MIDETYTVQSVQDSFAVKLDRLEQRMDALEKEVQELKRIENTKRNEAVEQFIIGLELLGYDLTLTSKGDETHDR